MVASIVERYYSAILGPFEDAYRRNVMEQRSRMNPHMRPSMPGPGQNAMPPGAMPQANASRLMDGPLPGQFLPAQATPFHPPNAMSGVGAGMPVNGATHTAMNGAGPVPMPKMPPGGFPAMAGTAPNGPADLEHDLETRKRKMQEAAESDPKRARQKTGAFC